MAKREMVEVVLYEDGTYSVTDVDSSHTTQRMYGSYAGKSIDLYFCPKANWKKYLLRLLSTKDLNKKIRELQKKKKVIENLRAQIEKEIAIDDRRDKWRWYSC